MMAKYTLNSNSTHHQRPSSPQRWVSHLVLMLTLITLPALLTACGGGDAEKTIKNERFGYTFKIPEGFELAIDKPTRIEITGPDAGEEDITPLITVIVEEYPELKDDNGIGQTNRPLELETYFIAMIQQRRAFFRENDFKIIDHKVDSLHQYKIAWLKYTYTVTEESKTEDAETKSYTFHSREYFLVRPDTAITYTIGFTFPDGAFKQHEKTIAAFLASFSLIDIKK